MATRKEGTLPDSNLCNLSLVDEAPSTKGSTGNCMRSDGPGYCQTSGNYRAIRGEKIDYTSVASHIPGYGPYASKSMVNTVGKLVSKRQQFLSGHRHHTLSYGSGAGPSYSQDFTSVENASIGTNRNMRNVKPSLDSIGCRRSSSTNFIKTNSSVVGRFSTLSLDSKSCQPAIFSKFQKPVYQSQTPKSSCKVPCSSSDFSADFVREIQPAGKLSSCVSHENHFLPRNAPSNFGVNVGEWNDSNSIELVSEPKSNGEFGAPTELTCGPRACNGSIPVNSSEQNEALGFSVQRDRYNREDFQTDYDSAKFYVIKSYNEDNIHRSVKYDVWSSTPIGNTKLDAAFSDAEAKGKETGKKCPLFLFFSVNGSGKFVGLAEMTGPVDFNKDMDFWQLDKWSGFFPLKWHVLKDIPNRELRHIILRDNDDRPVTFTRDTQEIGLKEGLEMLGIFKSYAAKTSILDDFNFYEKRETSVANSKPASEQLEAQLHGDFHQYLAGRERRFEAESSVSRKSSESSSVDLFDSGALRRRPQGRGQVKNIRGRSSSLANTTKPFWSSRKNTLSDRSSRCTAGPTAHGRR